MTNKCLQTQARLGEISLMAAKTTEGSGQQYVIEALKRFARSVELCDDFLRGYYGLKMVCADGGPCLLLIILIVRLVVR